MIIVMSKLRAPAMQCKMGDLEIGDVFELDEPLLISPGCDLLPGDGPFIATNSPLFGANGFTALRTGQWMQRSASQADINVLLLNAELSVNVTVAKEPPQPEPVINPPMQTAVGSLLPH